MNGERNLEEQVTLSDAIWNETISKGNRNFDEFCDTVLLDYQPGDAH